MSREDTRLIFSNVPELALFADMFTEQLEDALGAVVEGGNGQDRVGKLFLDIVRDTFPSHLIDRPSGPSSRTSIQIIHSPTPDRSRVS
jgi:hypothetical protein